MGAGEALVSDFVQITTDRIGRHTT